MCLVLLSSQVLSSKVNREKSIGAFGLRRCVMRCKAAELDYTLSVEE